MDETRYPSWTPGTFPNETTEYEWLTVLRRYVLFIAVANLVWEILQMPFYTLWTEGAPGQIAFAIVHCTAGDILIAGSCLLAAVLLSAARRWPLSGYWRVALIAFVFGLAYTIFSEWLNTEIRGSWAYADIMPTLPLIGSGVTPLAQWIILPSVGFWWARRTVETPAQ
jgi:hypothetical protein